MNQNKTYEWAIVGAGAAGIAAVGKLLDAKVNPETILWLDEQFLAGDLQQKWANVSSNTTVELFFHYLQACQSFELKNYQQQLKLNQLDKHATCNLGLMGEALLKITQILQNKVIWHKSFIRKIKTENRIWQLECAQNNTIFNSKRVILATGSEPKNLNYDTPSIHLETALDKQKLAKILNAQQTIAVFGSSHSSIIVLQNLVELNTHKIINFYLEPIKYAIKMGDEILYDNTGLKGNAALWAQNNLQSNMPNNLERYLVTSEKFKKLLSTCHKVIYTVGFDRRNNIQIAADAVDLNKYDPHTGIIAPGLFGLGIAFPELCHYSFGYSEYSIGVCKFIKYLEKIIPIWLRYPH